MLLQTVQTKIILAAAGLVTLLFVVVGTSAPASKETCAGDEWHGEKAYYDSQTTLKRALILNSEVHSMWMNHGWNTDSRGQPVVYYHQAGAELARMVAHRANLSATDVVLDVGFGYGDQDFIFATEFSVKRILGVNLATQNVNIARARARENGLGQHITFMQGDGASMPQVPSNSASKIICIEAALYFNTRTKFFGEALRILQPGGVLVITDAVLKEGTASTNLFKRFGFPPENNFPIGKYEELLLASGFRSVASEDITHRLYSWPDGKVKRVPLLSAIGDEALTREFTESHMLFNPPQYDVMSAHFHARTRMHLIIAQK